jgi:hypothetical protein
VDGEEATIEEETTTVEETKTAEKIETAEETTTAGWSPRLRRRGYDAARTTSAGTMRGA